MKRTKITVTIDKYYYDMAKDVADKIDCGVDNVIEDLIANCVHDCFWDELKKAEEVADAQKYDEQKEKLIFTRTLPSGGLLW